eukprot:jgi/Bigna1/129160/aug1.8_g3868
MLPFLPSPCLAWYAPIDKPIAYVEATYHGLTSSLQHGITSMTTPDLLVSAVGDSLLFSEFEGVEEESHRDHRLCSNSDLKYGGIFGGKVENHKKRADKGQHE